MLTMVNDGKPSAIITAQTKIESPQGSTQPPLVVAPARDVQSAMFDTLATFMACGVT